MAGSGATVSNVASQNPRYSLVTFGSSDEFVFRQNAVFVFVESFENAISQFGRAHRTRWIETAVPVQWPDHFMYSLKANGYRFFPERGP